MAGPGSCTHLPRIQALVLRVPSHIHTHTHTHDHQCLTASTCFLPLPACPPACLPARLPARLPACSSVKLDGSQQEEDDDASEEAFEECAAEDQKAGPAKKYRVSGWLGLAALS